MHSSLELALKNKLDYARFLHLLLIFFVAMLAFLFSNLPHSWWILAMALGISSNMEPGLIVGNSFHRMRGTIYALLILLPLLYILQINYRILPIVFIIALIGFNVASFNLRRYDITIFFITLAIILLIAQTTYVNTPEGPIEVAINRGVSTIIGIVIVILGDYVLFNSYRYSQKLYLLHQVRVYNFSNYVVKEIGQASVRNKNKFLLITKLRTETNDVFKMIATSAENLKLDLKTSPQMKEEVDLFQNLIWELRRVIFAFCFSELMLKSPSMSEVHLIRFKQLMVEIRKNFIKFERENLS